MIFNRSLYLLILLLIASGCVKEPEAGGDNLVDTFDRSAMLENLADQYIIPAYQNYLQTIQDFETALTHFENNPTLGALDTLRNEYFEGVTAWEQVSFLNFGPAEIIVLREQSNVYPADTSLINSNISSGSYDLAVTTNFSAKGWQTLDYLLFKHYDLQDAYNYFNDANVINYTKDLVDDLLFNTSYVVNQWSTFRSTFINNSASNANGSAVSEIMNMTISHYETNIRKGKIGIPVGVFNGFTQQPMPQHTEGLYSKMKLQLANQAVKAYQNFLNGKSFVNQTDGLGLLDYAKYVDATIDGKPLADAINQQFEKIKAVNNLATSSWSDFVLSNPPVSQEIYLEYQKLIPLLKIDLTSALGVIIVYQDNDGD